MAMTSSNSNSNSNREQDQPRKDHDTQGKEQGQLISDSPRQPRKESNRLDVAWQQSRAGFLRAGGSLLGVLAAGAIDSGLNRNPHTARAIDLGGVEFGFGGDDTFDVPPEDNPDKLKSPRPLAYRVEFSDPPMTVPFPKKLEDRLITELSNQQLLFMGTHGDSTADQVLAAGLTGRIAAKLNNRVAIGLEQVEREFQPALDAYVAEGSGPGGDKGQEGPSRDAADLELAKAIEWNERSRYPFDAFRPIFHLARSQGLPLVALGVDSKDAFQVLQNGIDALGEAERNEYVSDFKGFVTYVRSKGFIKYADQLIFPNYDRLKEEGLLGENPPTKPNFFSARILADEAVASKAVQWSTEHKNTPMVVLQSGDRVKYGFGASGRASRIGTSFGGELAVRTVMLNPTAAESLSGTPSLRLALEYADDLPNGYPFANYLWFGKSPRINQIPRMLNQEDKGWLESINLYDFRQAPPT